MYKGTQLSGVLFVLIVKKIPLSQFFYTSAAIDASDKYQVCAPPPTVKTGKTLMIWRYEASKSDPRSTLSLAEDCLRPN